MQPQNSSPSPNPQYDFILSEKQQQEQSQLSRLKSLPKLFLILITLGLALLLVLIFATIKNSSSQPQPLINALGYGQEIGRVSGLIQIQSKDPEAQALAATTQATLASSQNQMISYLAKTGAEIDPKSFLSYQNKKTDTELTEAASENKLEQTYYSYLKDELGKYKFELQNAKEAVGKTGKSIIDSSLSSLQIILSAPQLKNL
ncbi:hypothetical protein H0X09_03890 [Candidatus Saccharibacteria bacterium]|nr:hypothetical protein [Candidatus Saccharibacteria bacterium]